MKPVKPKAVAFKIVAMTSTFQFKRFYKLPSFQNISPALIFLICLLTKNLIKFFFAAACILLQRYQSMHKMPYV